jgi:two-component system, OmpR family, alkaline phosphatase synthesis response regulator PhoP
VTRKVLIAEDEPSIVTSLEFLLRQSKYEVRVARDGEEALRLVESFVPHLVLLDVMMPGKSGFEVCKLIRGNPAWRGMKVMMLSAKGRDSDAGQGLALGADAYLSKPFSTQALVARVRELLAEGA